MKGTLFKGIQIIIVAAAVAGIIVSCHKSPCPSISQEQYERCGCDPNVRFAVDILAAADLSNKAVASIVSCITGTVDVKIKDASKIKTELSGCVSKSVEVNSQVMKVIADISNRAASQAKPPSDKDICIWNNCIYERNENCDKMPVVINPPSPVEDKPEAYGLTFRKIVWKHFYLPNANFRGEVEYDVVNTSDNSVVILPPFQAAWFGHGLKKPKVTTEIYGDDKHAYTIEQGHFSTKEEIRKDLNGRGKQVTSYLWQFNIKPSLDPKKSLHYAIVIETKGTEKEAFTPAGSFAGMWSPYPVAELGCELYAPKGFKFKKETQFVRDRTGRMQELAGVRQPEFSDGDKKISWVVAKPIPNLEYLIKVVIVKAN